MFDPRSYREACGELRVSPETIEEVISMTEQKKQRRRPLRAALVAAAAVALMVVGVSAAHPEMLEEITLRVAQVLQVGELRQDLTTETGETVVALEIPEARLEDRDGRAVLLVMGEEIDVTDALEKDGRYEYRYADEGTELTVLVEGAPEDWTMTTAVGVPGEEGVVSAVTSSRDQGTGPEADRWAVAAGDGWSQGNGVTQETTTVYDGEALSAVPET